MGMARETPMLMPTPLAKSMPASPFTTPMLPDIPITLVLSLVSAMVSIMARETPMLMLTLWDKSTLASPFTTPMLLDMPIMLDTSATSVTRLSTPMANEIFLNKYFYNIFM